MAQFISSAYMNVLEQSLLTSSRRHKVISDNIANVNTPGFKRSDIRFQDYLQQALGNNGKLPLYTTTPKHIQGSMSSNSYSGVVVDQSTSMRNDGNNVDIDSEMTLMAENNLYYNAIAQQIAGYFTSLKSVINGGR